MMKCREARRLMYLYRDGEIPVETRRQVIEHASSCRRCARELRLAGKAQLFIADLRSTDPHVHAQRDLTDQVMRAVGSARTGGPSPRKLPARPFRRLQVACTWAAAVIVVVFFVQTSNDFYQIATLEARLRQVPSAPTVRSEELSLAAVGLNTMAEVGRILTQPPTPGNTGIHERLQLRKAMRSFFDVVEDGPPGFTGEVQRLRAKYPELWIVSPLHGLTPRDRVVLPRQGKALMRDLRTLLQPGRADNEK